MSILIGYEIVLSMNAQSLGDRSIKVLSGRVSVILLDMYMKTARWLTISLIESNAKALLINSITTTARRLQEYARLRW